MANVRCLISSTAPSRVLLNCWSCVGVSEKQRKTTEDQAKSSAEGVKPLQENAISLPKDVDPADDETSNEQTDLTSGLLQSSGSYPPAPAPVAA